MGFVDRQAPWTREDTRPFQNDQRLTRPTRIKRIGRGFFIGAHAVQMGETVTTDWTTAQDLIAFGKAVAAE